ncbi:hypothetical protein CSPAE12_08478 [Colletotrichum incanum]|nr:hypothetical protein CSPAE12_08478 [Colletotrichum incanum]
MFSISIITILPRMRFTYLYISTLLTRISSFSINNSLLYLKCLSFSYTK